MLLPKLRVGVCERSLDGDTHFALDGFEPYAYTVVESDDKHELVMPLCDDNPGYGRKNSRAYTYACVHVRSRMLVCMRTRVCV